MCSAECNTTNAFREETVIKWVPIASFGQLITLLWRVLEGDKRDSHEAIKAGLLPCLQVWPTGADVNTVPYDIVR